ncbi:hypothetical protein PV518_38495 [Streptomyces sp. ND04-05B]|uniref:hypothetical protein n=1 Tax=Streptomyces sp. ND04-05B TaxID=3028693 RepID=UPI0029A854B4|nr:hypothetical protein [Streptomyces sp. ND04-05B]MDX3067985.1 hypothetical protein [Streptomyces sp. ND04-05B]
MLVAALGVLAISALSTTPASAEAGWQSLGNSDFYPDADLNGCHTRTFSSGGGYIRYTFSRVSHDGEQTTLRIYEYDAGNADELIDTRHPYDGTVATVYVDNFTDGDNGKAEIYFKVSEIGCNGAPWVHVDD